MKCFFRPLTEECKEKWKNPSVAIAYDSRYKSREFAFLAANILSSMGVKAYVFNELTPTPVLSYAVRALKTCGGIVITASHNPKEYNGYKVYGADGAQMSPEDTQKVVEKIENITDYLSVSGKGDEKYIVPVPKTLDEDYVKSWKSSRYPPRR